MDEPRRMPPWAVAVVTVAAVLLVIPLLMMPFMLTWGWPWWHGDAPPGAMMGWMVVPLVLLLVLIVVLARAGGPPASDQSEALRILDERFARGEIDADEYRARKDELLR